MYRICFAKTGLCFFSKCKLFFFLRQKNNKGWKKRWFVFDGTDLKYFKDKVNFDDVTLAS